MNERFTRLKAVIEANDLAGAADVLTIYGALPEMLARNHDRIATHVLKLMLSAVMPDLFLQRGLSPKHVSELWAPGFGLHSISTTVAVHIKAATHSEGIL